MRTLVLQILLLLLVSTFAAGQQADTTRVIELAQKADEFRNKDRKSALQYAHEARALAGKLSYKTGLMRVHTLLGIIYMQDSKYPEAISHYDTALTHAIGLMDPRGQARIYNNKAMVYFEQSANAQALENYLKALRINESGNYKRGIYSNYANMGNVYESLGDTQKALACYERALRLARELGDRLQEGGQLGNLGITYFRMGDFGKALQFEREALQIAREIGDPEAESIDLSSIANTFKALKQYDSAFAAYQAALAIDRRLDRKDGIAVNLANLGALYKDKGETEKAIAYCLQAEAIAREASVLYILQQVYKDLSELYETKRAYTEALRHYRNYVNVRDSIFNEENTKKMVRSEMNFEFEKKEAAARLEQDKKDAIAVAEAKRQRILLFSISAFGLLVLGFAAFAWKSFLQKKKANEEISRQKHLIEEKQKEILDSIHYAKRIQRTLMPTDAYITRCLTRTR